MAFRLAGLFLPTPAGALPKSVTPAPLSDVRGKAINGHYWCGELNFYRRIRFRDGALTMDAGEGEVVTKLIHIGDGRFVFERDPSRPVTFEQAGRSGMRLIVGGPPAIGFDAIRYDPTPPRYMSEIEPLVGEYTSDELGATYKFWREGGNVLFRINEGEPQSVPSARGWASMECARHALDQIR